MTNPIVDDWVHDDPHPHPDAEADAFEDGVRHRQQVDKRLRELREYEDARAILRREQRAQQTRPRPVRLDQFLARSYAAPSYRIDGLLRTGSRVMLAAQWKAGKTTMVANLIRALVDNEPFLDRFTVTPGARIALIDNELDEQTLHEWLTAQGITNTAAVSLVPLRGRVATFDILDAEARAEWANDLTGHDLIVFDCLRPVLDALGLDENRDAGRFLVAFDALLAESGANEAVVVHHMGHTGERSRGDSRLQDWPDALWKLVRDKDEDDDTIDDPTGSRYFSAFGRDVNVTQAELTFDPTTRRLALSEHARNRRQANTHRRIVKADEAVLSVVTSNRGINKTGLRTAVRDQHQIGRNEDIDNAVERLVQQGLIHRTKAGNTHLHYPHEKTLTDPEVPDMPNMPPPIPGTGADTCPPPIEGARTNHTPEQDHR